MDIKDLKIAAGDVDKVFAEAPVTVKERYYHPRLIPNAMEPRGVLAQPMPITGEMTMWSSTQIPHILRTLLALTPGPNMSLILASTLTNGLRAGLVTLAGTTTGLALLVAAAAAGMSSVMVFMSEWFDVIRWVGALYLVYLGARQLWLLRRRAAGCTGCDGM